MITLLIPTFNEKDNIGVIIPKIFEVVPDISILVIDDASPDGTARLVKEMMNKYPNLSVLERKGKEGLGKAYIAAFQHVLKNQSIDSVIMMDADLSHDPDALPDMIKASLVYDCVIGSRYISSGKIVGWELWRRGLSFFGNLYCRLVTGLPIRDCTGGFNLIKTEVLKKIDFTTMDSSGYAFIMELKYMLYKKGARVKELPITFRERVNGVSKISHQIIREGLLAPWKMRWKSPT